MQASSSIQLSNLWWLPPAPTLRTMPSNQVSQSIISPGMELLRCWAGMTLTLELSGQNTGRPSRTAKRPPQPRQSRWSSLRCRAAWQEGQANKGSSLSNLDGECVCTLINPPPCSLPTPRPFRAALLPDTRKTNQGEVHFLDEDAIVAVCLLQPNR